VKWAASTPVPPGKAVRVMGYTVEGKMDVTWTGKVTSRNELGRVLKSSTNMV